MSRGGIALRLAVAVSLACVGGATALAAVGSAASTPRIDLSTTTIVPGQQIKVTGYGWPGRALIYFSVCGADAVNGTSDCNASATSSVITFPTGYVTGRMTGAAPPQPCPCVVLAQGLATNTQLKIPVSVVGVATAPLPPGPTIKQPDLKIQDLRVLSTVTLASAMGASAPRTVEFQIHNAGPYAETPWLTGRWGHPTEVHKAITMPWVGSLAPGATKDVRATFSLPALSMGTYKVQVTAKVVGFSKRVSSTASTTQWPYGLFAALALFLLLLLLFLLTRPRQRRRKKPPPPVPQAPGDPVRLASSAESEARSGALSGR